MQDFVAHSNVQNFRKRLMNEADADIHAMMRKLLVMEEDKLARDLAQLSEAEDAIRTLKAAITRQRARIADLEAAHMDATLARSYLASLFRTLRVHTNYHRFLDGVVSAPA